MMNIRNLGSKGSAWVTFKDDICAKMHLKLWFESDWHFCNVTSQGGFENDCPEARVKLVQKQPYAHVLQNFATGRHLYWSLFLIKLKKRLQHRCFPVNIAKLLRVAFFIEHLQWVLLSV